MVQKKASGSVRKLSHRGKEMFLKEFNLSPQPIVCLTRLNIPESFMNAKTTNFTINVNSNSFRKIVTNINTQQSKLKERSSKTVKPMKRLQKNKRQSFAKSKSDLLLKNETNQDGLFVPVTENDDKLFINDNVGQYGISNHESKSKNQSVDKENQCSDTTNSLGMHNFGLEDQDDATPNEGNHTESITRTDKVIDTFLHVLRKTTDDNSILSALQRDYICDRCQQGFLKKGSLRKHMLICCLGKGGKKSKKRKKEEKHSCPMCGITYLNKYSLDKHNANIHNLKKMYKCLVCSQHFYNEDALTLHCRSRHGLGGSNIYKCPYCEAAFNLRGDLNYHCRRAHNTTQYYICSKCLECFRNEDTCKLHEQSHGYCCDICMYKTKSESEMIAHKSIHLYMVVHKCDKCSRTFKAKQYFTKHVKVHERERKL